MMRFPVNFFQMTNFRDFKLKELAEDNLKCDENGGKLSKKDRKNCG